MGIIRFHTELLVYQKSFDLAMEIFNLSKSFPKEETYSLTNQIRRSSRSVCANIAEAWGKRRYSKSFISKLTDAEAEARETQTWLEFSKTCDYIIPMDFEKINTAYNQIIGMLVSMITNTEKWTSFKSLEE